MPYQHRWLAGGSVELPLGKIVCVGRNYAAHARELNNPLPREPLLFIKPATSAVALEQPLLLPLGQGAVHFETEIAVLIGAPLCRASAAEAASAIRALGLALDLTLRDLQSALKAQGHPWERAKGFDGACPLSPWIERSAFADLEDIAFTLELNGAVRQIGHSAQMLWPIVPLIAAISAAFSLEPGDVVLTGTPAGVGPLDAGDHLLLRLSEQGRFETRVAVPAGI